MKKMKKLVTLVMIPVLLCFQCKDLAEPEAKEIPSLRRFSPEAIQKVKLGSERAWVVVNKFKANRKSISHGKIIEYGNAEYRNQLTDPMEIKMFDEVTNHPEFKKLRAYLSSFPEQTKAGSGGKTQTLYWDEDDYYVSAACKSYIHNLNTDLKDVFDTAPYQWSNAEVLIACNYRVDVFANAVANATDLTQYDKDLLGPGIEMLYENLPSMIDQNRGGYEDSRTKGRLGNIMGSWILHAFIVTVAVVAITMLVAATFGVAGTMAAMLASAQFISIGAATFELASLAVGIGLVYGGVLAAGMAGSSNECLTSVPNTYRVEYQSCD